MTGPFATEYYVYAFGGIYDPNIDVSALSGEKCNDYFIRYNASDTDTLRLCYRVTEGECGLYFEATKAYYQNQLILHKQGAAPVIDIVK
ncbi:MAG: hypothetical protein MUD08_14365 [Cytophagales bacterium]|nr:hypothetical protein [Cytophagales bacterium]